MQVSFTLFDGQEVEFRRASQKWYWKNQFNDLWYPVVKDSAIDIAIEAMLIFQCWGRTDDMPCSNSPLYRLEWWWLGKKRWGGRNIRLTVWDRVCPWHAMYLYILLGGSPFFKFDLKLQEEGK